MSAITVTMDASGGESTSPVDLQTEPTEEVRIHFILAELVKYVLHIGFLIRVLTLYVL